MSEQSDHDEQYEQAVRDRTEAVRERIRAAGGHDVEIVGVTKGADVDAVRAAVSAGIRCIGENFAQEMIPKVRSARSLGLSFESHFIGQLQTNKVRQLAEVVDVWQSVDREAAAEEIARRAPGSRVLVQVNLTGGAGKGGCSPAELDALVAHAVGLGLEVDGLMTVGPTNLEPTATRAAFRATRAAVDRLGLRTCSMGMSADLEIAVQEGATLLRIGTAIFGERAVRGTRRETGGSAPVDHGGRTS